VNHPEHHLCCFHFSADKSSNEQKNHQKYRSTSHKNVPMITHFFLKLLLWLVVASGFITRFHPATAFSTIIPPHSSAILNGRNSLNAPFQRSEQHTQWLYSVPPPLSGQDDNNYDDYTSSEISKMEDVIVSLSKESNDEARRSRLQQIMEVGLAGPNGGPKRFAHLFQRVLTQVGENVQNEARKKYSEQATADVKDGIVEDSLTTESSASSEEKIAEKSPEELRLWALVDMMVQSKTIIKKQPF